MLKDFAGKWICVGAYVAYPHAHGSSAARLKIGKVLDINTEKQTITVRSAQQHLGVFRRQCRNSVLHFPDRWIVVEEYNIKDEILKVLNEECTRCSGDGVERNRDGILIDDVCCECGGAGWVD